MASSAILRLAVVTLAAFLLFAPLLIEARPQRKLCAPRLESISWACAGPQLEVDVDNDCSVQQGKKVLKYVTEKLVGEGWPALTTSRVMQEYVRMYVASKMCMKVCIWYNNHCKQQCAGKDTSCVTSCLSMYSYCKSRDPTDCCKTRPGCNHTAQAGGRGLLDDNHNIKTVQDTKPEAYSNEQMAETMTNKVKTSGIEPKAPACGACATNTIQENTPRKRMTCSFAGGEGPPANSNSDPNTPTNG